MQTAEFLHDLFRAATGGREFHARCAASEGHNNGCVFNAAHEGPCWVLPLDPVTPEIFFQLTEGDNNDDNLRRDV